jgi:glutathione S-transferase
MKRTTTMALALYHNDMSSCAQKVRLMLAEKGLEWESRHLDLRAGEHQQDWYIKLNPRAVVPTLIDGDIVVPESNVINEYLDERFPDPVLKPSEPFGRAKMRLWTKQLDEGVHDAGIAVLSFGVAFRHQYMSRGEAGRQMLESIPDPVKRERRRDVIEKGLDSPHFKMAIERLLALYRDI